MIRYFILLYLIERQDQYIKNTYNVIIFVEEISSNNSTCYFFRRKPNSGKENKYENEITFNFPKPNHELKGLRIVKSVNLYLFSNHAECVKLCGLHYLI